MNKKKETALTKHNQDSSMGCNVKPSVFYIDYEAINKKGTCSSKDILLFHIQPNALFLLKNKQTLINL